MTVIASENLSADTRTNSRLYRAVWRWHFYAGLFVVPFLIFMACTGMVMLYGNSVDTMLGPRHYVASTASLLPLTEQAKAAAAAVPGGTVSEFIQRPGRDQASLFLVDDKDGAAHVVAIDPGNASVIDDRLKNSVLFNLASNIHGTLLLPPVGSYLLEIAAGLGIIMLLTGLYMWWPRGGRSWQRALMPRLLTGRAFWREMHMSTGFYLSIILLFFLLSGLAWTNVWGGKLVQAWNTFPAEKTTAPLSDLTHASLNDGDGKQVPWTLEQTPMPASMPGMDMPPDMPGMDMGGGATGKAAPKPAASITLDSVAATARQMGFDQQVQINLPVGETGVFTISQNSMSGDTSNPFGDRTVHIDQYSGKVLADIGFADYGIGGKAMAAGIALHQGNLGWWNTLLNLIFCCAVIFISVSGVVMWWKRRPTGRFAAPLYPRAYRTPVPVLLAALAVCICFPLTGAAVILFAILDLLLPKRLKMAGAA